MADLAGTVRLAFGALHGLLQLLDLLGQQVVVKLLAGLAAQDDIRPVAHPGADYPRAHLVDGPHLSADDALVAGAYRHRAAAVDLTVDDALGLQIHLGIDAAVFQIFGKNAPLSPDYRLVVPLNAPGHDQVPARLHRAGLHHAVHRDGPHGPDAEAAANVPVDTHIPQKVDISHGIVHISRDIQHGLDLEAAAAELHVAGNGGDQRRSVLGQLRVAAFRHGDRLPVLGGELCALHGPARDAVGGRDDVADYAPLFHVVDKMQVGVVHPASLVDGELPLLCAGEQVHHPAIRAVHRRCAPGHGEERKIALRVLGERVQQLLVNAAAHPLGRQGLVQIGPRKLPAIARRGVDQQPGRQAVFGQEDDYLGVQIGQWGLLPLLALGGQQLKALAG